LILPLNCANAVSQSITNLIVSGGNEDLRPQVPLRNALTGKAGRLGVNAIKKFFVTSGGVKKLPFNFL
jgi:hypothetical protein